MSKIYVTDRDGAEHAVEAQEGSSVMEILRDGGVGDILAICGGVCACATCHVYVEPGFEAALPPFGEDEEDMLSCSDARQSNSRLSCQIQFHPALDGLKVTVAPG